MQFLLNDKCQTIMRLDITVLVTGIIVNEIDVLHKELLPEELSETPVTPSGVTAWLEQRAIPNDRTNLDRLLLDAYGYDAYKFGRMYQYQHTAALLSYYISGFDYYWLNPEEVYPICFVYQDRRFSRLHFLKPICYEEMLKIRDCPDPEIERVFYQKKEGTWVKFHPSPSYTLPFHEPSWWEMQGGKKVLMQLDDKKKQIVAYSKYKYN